MERVEHLDYGLKIYQNSELYTFTSDAVLLAKFAKVKNGETIADLGSGSGIISLYLAKKADVKKIYAVEIQKKLAEMSKKSVELNNLQNKIEIINENMLNLSLQVDVVVTNPPYKKFSSIKNENSSRAIARHEIEINLTKLLKTASKMLKEKGRFYICYDSNRTAELIYNLKLNKLEPKKMFFTYANINKNASIVFVEAVKCGKEEIKILPPIITNNENGKYIENLEIKDV